MTAIELMGTSQQVVWGMTSIQFFFMVQVAAACIGLAAAQRLVARQALEPYAGVGLFLGLGLAVTAPLNLILELHQPLRFLSMLYRTHLTSPLSWGVFILLGFMLVSACFALVVLREKLTTACSDNLDRRASGGRVKVLALLTLLAATLIFLYSSMDLAAVKGRGLWHSSIVPVVFICSALAAATGLSGLFAMLVKRLNQERLTLLRGWLGFFLTLQLFAQVLWFLIAFVFGDSFGRFAFDYILAAGFGNFIVLGLGGTILLPLVLLYWARSSRLLFALAALLSLAGAYLVRWNVIITGQQLPRTGTALLPFAPEWWGQGGLLQALAPLALWILLMILATWTGPWKRLVGQQQEG
ncbi:NrfD/PsrC family molybdoenzyme membrane anchor subunit [Pelobacter seleniigenes]|uniref:NrfD/PsrC family molybdoenzyme membrane anchor subunit n=1 Tax=Pelobacter seleniigenes TaxID=407188 RepID=UPI0004A6BCCE|nr:NrfD/PsrC family molybdoenzyme membrane anchor subunit [Pelobacter seleniigenes]